MSSDLTPPLNLLIAYPYMSANNEAVLRELDAQSGVRWLLDSGAFTAWKSGKPILLDDYCRFLKALPVQPWRYIALDVVGDAKATERNYLEMLQRGFRPVPVFTRGESLDVLDRYYETSDLVCIGGLVSRVNAAKPYLKHLRAHLGERHYHVLGFTSLDWIKYLRPYSVDSSSWDRASRFGILNVYMGRGRLESLTYRELGRLQHNDAMATRVRALGFDFADLFKPENWRGGVSLSRLVSAASWMWLSIEMEKQLGTRLFLAHTGAVPQVPALYARALRAAGYVTASPEQRTA